MCVDDGEALFLDHHIALISSFSVHREHKGTTQMSGHPCPSSFWTVTAIQKGLDNIVALLECSDRVREINLRNISSLHYFEQVLAATQYSEAIPTADKSDALVAPSSSSSQDASRSRLVPGCICPTSARTLVGTDSVSGLTETTFCY